MNGIAMQLQKDKENNILEGHQKIIEFELWIEDVHVKYEGIISKERVIKNQEQRINDAIYL